MKDLIELLEENNRLWEENRVLKLRSDNAFKSKAQAVKQRDNAIKNLNDAQIIAKRLRLALEEGARSGGRSYLFSLNEVNVLLRMVQQNQQKGTTDPALLDEWLKWVKIHRATSMPRPDEVASVYDLDVKDMFETPEET